MSAAKGVRLYAECVSAMPLSVRPWQDCLQVQREAGTDKTKMRVEAMRTSRAIMFFAVLLALTTLTVNACNRLFAQVQLMSP